MYVAGEWVSTGSELEVIHPFSGEVIDSVPTAGLNEVELALEAAVQGAAAMRRLTAHERAEILNRAASIIEERLEDLATTITLEVGKPIRESRGEVGRVPDLLRLSAFEGSQLRGETLPVDAQKGVSGKLAFTLRVPCGVVVAITPFNYPLLLVAHKVGPALAAGNSVVLKPASQTPFAAIALTEILLEAGLPPTAIQCITGPGSGIGSALVSDPRVRKVTFTGSSDVGRSIAHHAGAKKLSLELGANCPLIVMSDGDVELAADATVRGGFANAGQVCISTQRVLADRMVYDDYLDALVHRVESIQVGNPREDASQLSSMISEQEAIRVESWIGEAVSHGARLLTGASRDKAVLTPAVLADVPAHVRLARDELFGPAVAVSAASSIDEAISQVNLGLYGLGAGLFTRDLAGALNFSLQVEAGTVMINESPQWRADLMPYGGLKASGFGREGPRYAIDDMTETKTIVVHGLEDLP